MEIKYQIFESEKLLIQKFIGFFSIELYMRYSQLIMQHPASSFINQVLIDFRDINFDDIPDDFIEGVDKVKEIRRKIQENEIKREDTTVVFWVDKPIPTVIAHTFKKNFPNLIYSYCSTEENVLKFMELPEHLLDLESITRNLENTFRDGS